jgi:hypothetical protein
VVHYPFKYRAKREPVMPAERCGKPKYWNSFLSRNSVGIVLWTLNFRMKEGQYAAVSERKGKLSITTQRRKNVDRRGGRSVMSLVNYYGLETLRGEFVQAPGLEQGLVRCDCPF